MNYKIYKIIFIININKIQNKSNNSKFKIEFNKLWIHGLVHLFGYDHKSENDFKIMRRMEKKYYANASSPLNYISKLN